MEWSEERKLRYLWKNYGPRKAVGMPVDRLKAKTPQIISQRTYWHLAPFERYHIIEDCFIFSNHVWQFYNSANDKVSCIQHSNTMPSTTVSVAPTIVSEQYNLTLYLPCLNKPWPTSTLIPVLHVSGGNLCSRD